MADGLASALSVYSHLQWQRSHTFTPQVLPDAIILVFRACRSLMRSLCPASLISGYLYSLISGYPYTPVFPLPPGRIFSMSSSLDMPIAQMSYPICWSLVRMLGYSASPLSVRDRSKRRSFLSQLAVRREFPMGMQSEMMESNSHVDQHAKETVHFLGAPSFSASQLVHASIGFVLPSRARVLISGNRNLWLCLRASMSAVRVSCRPCMALYASSALPLSLARKISANSAPSYTCRSMEKRSSFTVTQFLSNLACRSARKCACSVAVSLPTTSSYSLANRCSTCCFRSAKYFLTNLCCCSLSCSSGLCSLCRRQRSSARFMPASNFLQDYDCLAMMLRKGEPWGWSQSRQSAREGQQGCRQMRSMRFWCYWQTQCMGGII